MSANKILSIVVPCYNEESILANSIEILTGKIAELMPEELVSLDSFLLCVDDGSSDRTWEIIQNARANEI